MIVILSQIGFETHFWHCETITSRLERRFLMKPVPGTLLPAQVCDSHSYLPQCVSQMEGVTSLGAQHAPSS